MSAFTDHPMLTNRFTEATTVMLEVHHYQVRKVNEIPYACHLLQVAGMVLEAGGSEDEAIIALMHDAIENAGVSPERIEQLFGQFVREGVVCLTEDQSLPKGVARKDDYVRRLAIAHASFILVSAADKLHSLRSYATDGRHLWNDTVARFYKQLMPIYEACERVPRAWIEEMERLLLMVEGDVVMLSRAQYEQLQHWADEGRD